MMCQSQPILLSVLVDDICEILLSLTQNKKSQAIGQNYEPLLANHSEMSHSEK